MTDDPADGHASDLLTPAEIRARKLLDERELRALAWSIIAAEPWPIRLLHRARLRRSRRVRLRRLFGVPLVPSAAEMALAAGVIVFAKAYLEALGTRAGEGTASLPKKLSDLVRARARKKNAPDELHIGVKDGEAATLVVSSDLPDEARLAILDLDVTTPELRGKLLRWDTATGAWRPSEEVAAKPDGGTSTG